MKIALVQFNPTLTAVSLNQSRVNTLLSAYSTGAFDLLVLPELAFSGYVFSSLDHIQPYLEHPETGPSVKWAKETARRFSCHVIIGYPELGERGHHFNSAALVSPSGEVMATHRKHHLFETDETWATEGPHFTHVRILELGITIAIGICMDLNPYLFRAPFEKYEFARFVHAIDDCELVVMPMAWLSNGKVTNENKKSWSELTVNYWAARLRPLYDSDICKQSIRRYFAACNRIGEEQGVLFAGSSCVLELESPQPAILDGLGRGEENILVVDIPIGAKR